MDDSTDVSNIDEKMFLMLWCDTDGNDKKSIPECECLQQALQQFGVSVMNAENCKRLVGIGTDGASANVAAAGLKKD